MPSGYDVYIADDVSQLGLMLYEGQGGKPQRKTIQSYWTPSGEGAQDVSWSSWHQGYGWSQPGIVEDGYAYTINGDSRSPGIFMPAGAITEVDLTGITSPLPLADLTNVTSFIDKDLHFYLLLDRYALKFTDGVGTPTVSHDLGLGHAFISATQGRYSGTAYTFFSHDTGFGKFDGSIWTVSTSFLRGQLKTVYWETTDGVLVQRIAAGDPTGYGIVHVPLTTDPMVNGNWSSVIYVGDATWPIQSIVSTGRHVYVATVGGLYDVDDLGQTVNLAPYYQDQINSRNGYATIPWDGYILYGAGSGIDAIDIRQPGVSQQQANWATPGAGLGLPNETPIWGQPTAFTQDAGWVVMAIYNGTDSYIVYGKRRERLGFAGPGEWIWHGALAMFPGARVLHMNAADVEDSGSLVSRRLWIVTTDGSAVHVYHQSLPLGSTSRQDVSANTAHRFATSYDLFNTPKDWAAAGKTKTLVRASFDTRDLSSAATLSLSASADEGDFGSALATVSVSPSFQTPIAASETSGNQIAPKIVGTGTATTPPVLKALTLRAIIDPDPAQVFEFTAWLQRDQTIKHGGINSHSTPEIDYQLLSTFQSRVVTYTHIDDTVYTVFLEASLPSELIEIEQGESGTRSWGRRVAIKLRALDQPARYNVDLYDLTGRYS